MDMVGHQDPGPAGNACCFQVFSEKIAIQCIVGVGEEGALTAVAALGDVVRQAGNDKTGESGHGSQVTWVGAPGQLNALSP